MRKERETKNAKEWERKRTERVMKRRIEEEEEWGGKGRRRRRG